MLIKASGPLTDTQLQQLQDASAVIVGTNTSTVSARDPNSAQMRMVNQLIEQADAPVIGVGIRNPYDIMAFPDIDAYLAQYGFRDASFKATAATLFGENNPTGLLPVTLPSQNGGVLYDYGSWTFILKRSWTKYEENACNTVRISIGAQFPYRSLCR